MKKNMEKLKEKKYIVSKTDDKGKGKTNIRKRILVFLVIVAILSLGYLFKDNLYSIFEISYRKKYNKILSTREISQLEKKLNIIEKEYDIKAGETSKNKPKLLIYHHAAGNGLTPENIDEIHEKKGWDGIGYHYYIRKDGKIYRGRPENMEGAHTIGKNKSSIGICLEGNFQEDEISSDQKESIEKLSLYLCLKYDITDIIGHRDVYNTLCPGKNINVDDLEEDVIKLIEEQ